MQLSNLYHLLRESLDKPYELEDVTDLLPDGALQSKADQGYSDIKFYNCSDSPNQAFFIGKRDGAYEVHHQHIIDGKEAEGKNLIPDFKSSRFVSTAFHLGEQKLNHGESLRIIAPDHHIDHYHRLATLISNRRGFKIEPTHYPYPEAPELRTFLIRPAGGIKFGFPIRKS